MTIKDMILLGDAVERISEIADCTIPEIVDALAGIAWSEEDAGSIKRYHSEEDDA